MNIRFSVVVIAKNEPRIRYTLESLVRQSVKPWEVIIVVDDPNDISAVIAKEYMHALPIRVVVNNVSGFGGARASGVSAANGDIIAFIDADCIADEMWIENYARAFEEQRDVPVQVGGNFSIKDPSEVSLVHLGKIRAPFSDFEFTQNMAFRREVINIVGNFDPLFNEGGEDLDFFIRLKKSKIAVYRNPKAIVYHITTGVRLRKAWRDGKTRAKNFIKHGKAQLKDASICFFHAFSLFAFMGLLSAGKMQLALLAITPSILHRIYRAFKGHSIKSLLLPYISHTAFILYLLLQSWKRG
ncbi:MAG: glycosyltransferase family A protein [Nitrososphaerota archaeon]